MMLIRLIRLLLCIAFKPLYYFTPTSSHDLRADMLPLASGREPRLPVDVPQIIQDECERRIQNQIPIRNPTKSNQGGKPPKIACTY